MVRSWYMDDDPGDQRLEHHRNPPEYLSLDELFEKTGVEYFKVNISIVRFRWFIDKLYLKFLQ